MRCLFRSLLLCLMVLALPTQGVVAATMVFCHGHPDAGVAFTASHHGTDAVSAAHPASHGHAPSAALHEHANHGGAAIHTESAASTGSTADVDATRAAASDPHKCSACAVCCAATATSSTMIAVPAPVVAPTLFSAVVAVVEPFALGGPDRPPRSRIVMPA